MTDSEHSSVFVSRPAIVATVHSAESLAAAKRLRAPLPDFLELRVDHFAPHFAPLLEAATRLPAPRIVTVRHPAEGGMNSLRVSERRRLFAQFLPVASAIDVELRSVAHLAGTIAFARANGATIILSAHDFRATPSHGRLQELVDRAVRAGADIVKIAARAEAAADLNRLLTLLTRRQPRPLSVMAMGRFGKMSRLLLAQAGSVLNYGYLGTPNASGQWPAATLRARLAELES